MGVTSFFVIIGTLLVLGFGLFVVVMIVVGSARSRRVWAGESIVLTEEQKASLEDAAADGSTAAVGESTTDAMAIAQVQRNYLTNNPTGPL